MKKQKPCDRSGRAEYVISVIYFLAVLSAVSAGLLGLKRQKLLQLWLIAAFPVGFTEQRESVLSVAAAGQYCMEYACAIERGIGRVTESVFPGVLWSAQSMDGT